MLKLALGFLTILAPPPSRQGEDFDRLGNNFWWAAPATESLCVAIPAGLCVLLHPFMPPGVLAVLFVGMDHIAHGLRRLDGFSDLGEAIFFRLSNPQKTCEEAWRVVRAPQNGPYGTALISLLLLAQVALVGVLLERGAIEFFLGTFYAALFSKLGIAIAVAAPDRFRPASDFGRFAQKAGTLRRLIPLAMIILVLSAGAAWALGRVVPILFASLIVAVCAAGFLARRCVLRYLGELNGDVLGFGWAVSELVVLILVNVMGGIKSGGR